MTELSEFFIKGIKYGVMFSMIAISIAVCFALVVPVIALLAETIAFLMGAFV